jgi:hypothetical protein
MCQQPTLDSGGMGNTSCRQQGKGLRLSIYVQEFIEPQQFTELQKNYF